MFLQLLTNHRSDRKGLVARFLRKLDEPRVAAIADGMRGEYGCRCIKHGRMFSQSHWFGKGKKGAHAPEGVVFGDLAVASRGITNRSKAFVGRMR